MHPSSKRIGQIGLSRRWVLVSLAAIVFVTGGCKIARETVRLPGQMMAAVVPGKRSSLPDPAQLQSEVLRYADQFSSRTLPLSMYTPAELTRPRPGATRWCGSWRSIQLPSDRDGTQSDGKPS
jgi:hypothetical protein